MFNKVKMLLLPPERKFLSAPKVNSYEEAYYKIRRSKLRVKYYSAIAFFLVICILASTIVIKTNAFALVFEKINAVDFSDIFSFQSIQSGSTLDFLEGILIPSQGSQENNGNTDGTETLPPKMTLEQLYEFDYTAVPEGETPIIPMDLSLTSYGNTYIQNSTGLVPNTEALLNMTLGQNIYPSVLVDQNAPTVLIIHTHGTEAYSEDGAISYRDNGETLARSENTEENVVSLGALVAERLNKAGINTIHCEIMHDKNEYRNSYTRAEETIKKYLEKYPTITLVIDLHRDAVVRSSGELVRPVTLVEGEAAAQIMCVVGSSWGGEENPYWESNLALALKFREALNSKYENICRPPYLKSSTYNQELAKYSLLIELGSAGNSYEEAKISAEAVADAIISLRLK